MKGLGIHTGADLRNHSIDFLQGYFGKAGSWYYGLARGEDHRPVEPNQPRKSSGAENTFASDLTDPTAIEAGVIAMADDVWQWCQKTGQYGRTVTVKTKFADFKQLTRSRSALAPITSRETFDLICLDLIRSIYPPRMGIRLLGVAMSNFDQDDGAGQMDLELAV